MVEELVFLDDEFCFEFEENEDVLKVTISSPTATKTKLPSWNENSMKEYHYDLEYLLAQITPAVLSDRNGVWKMPEALYGRLCLEYETDCFQNIQYRKDGKAMASVRVDHGALQCLENKSAAAKLVFYITRGLHLSLNDGHEYQVKIKANAPMKDQLRLFTQLGAKSLIYAMMSAECYDSELFCTTAMSRSLFSAPEPPGLYDQVYNWFYGNTEPDCSATDWCNNYPFMASALRLSLCFDRMTRGDYIGGVGELASGYLSLLPGGGTVSALVDALLFSKDACKTVSQAKVNRFAKTLPILDSKIYGCGHGSYFDESDLDFGELRKIHVWSGGMIDAILLEYEKGDGRKHGGKGGTQKTLDLQDEEFISEVHGKLHSRGISYLKFVTNFNRMEDFGSIHDGSQDFEFKLPPNAKLTAIRGFDAFNGEGETRFPLWPGHFELLPGVGFIGKQIAHSDEETTQDEK